MLRLPRDWIARDWVARALHPAVLALAASAMLVYLVLGVLHLRYPFELNWLEGSVVDEVRRAASGQKLYVRPSIDFVPYLYPPLYFYVSAALTKLFGVGFFAPRLVSYLSSIGILALIARFVHRETGGDRGAALLAAGLFAGTYVQSSAFFDIARVDSFFLVLALASLYLVRFHPSPRGRAGAALLFTLAFLTKQTTTFIFLPAALHVVLVDRRRALLFVGAALALMLGSVLVLDRIHEGWFWYFVFWLPRQHLLVHRMAYDFWVLDLLPPLAIACLIALFYLLAGGAEAEARRFYALAAAGLFGCSWIGRLHSGGLPNVLMPAFAALAILFGLGFHRALALARAASEETRRSAEALVLLLSAIQLGCLIYDPRRFAPTAKDREAGEALVASIRAIDGDVFVSAHSYLGVMAGKRSFAHEMAMEDILCIGGGEPGLALRDELKKALREKRFAAVVPDTGWYWQEIEESYAKEREAVSSPATFLTVSGTRTRPKGIYLPR